MANNTVTTVLNVENKKYEEALKQAKKDLLELGKTSEIANEKSIRIEKIMVAQKNKLLTAISIQEKSLKSLRETDSGNTEAIKKQEVALRNLNKIYTNRVSRLNKIKSAIISNKKATEDSTLQVEKNLAAQKRQFTIQQEYTKLTDKNTQATDKQAKSTELATNKLVRYARQFGTLVGVYYAVSTAWKATLGTGIEVNRMIEDNTSGIAALLSANTQMVLSNGQAVTSYEKFAMGQALATKTMKDLRKASVETFATTGELTLIFQQAIGQTLGMGDAYGETTEKVIENTINLSKSISNIAGSIGMEQDRVKEEIRSMLSGNASTDSLISTMLFGSPGDANSAIAKAKQNGTNGVKNLIEGVMSAFKPLENIRSLTRGQLEWTQAWETSMATMVKDSGLFGDITDAYYSMAKGLTGSTDEIVQSFDAFYNGAKDVIDAVENIAVPAAGIASIYALSSASLVLTTSLKALTVAAMKNPFVAGAVVLGTAGYTLYEYFQDLNEEIEKTSNLLDKSEKDFKKQEDKKLKKDIEFLGDKLLEQYALVEKLQKDSNVQDKGYLGFGAETNKEHLDDKRATKEALEKYEAMLKQYEVMTLISGENSKQATQQKEKLDKAKKLLEQEGVLQTNIPVKAKLLEEAQKRNNKNLEETLQLEKRIKDNIIEIEQWKKRVAATEKGLTAKGITPDSKRILEAQLKQEQENIKNLEKDNIASLNNIAEIKAKNDKKAYDAEQSSLKAQFKSQDLKRQIAILNGTIADDEVANAKIAKDNAWDIYQSKLKTAIKQDEIDKSAVEYLKLKQKYEEEITNEQLEQDKIARKTLASSMKDISEDKDTNKDGIFSLSELDNAKEQLKSLRLKADDIVSPKEKDKVVTAIDDMVDDLQDAFDKSGLEFGIQLSGQENEITLELEAQKYAKENMIPIDRARLEMLNEELFMSGKIDKVQYLANAKKISDIANIKQELNTLQDSLEPLTIDIQLNGWDEVSNGIAGVANGFIDLQKNTVSFVDEFSKAGDNADKQSSALQGYAQGQVSSFASMSDGLSSFYDEDDDRRKKQEEVTKALHATKMVMQAAEMIQSGIFTQLFVTQEATKAQAAGATAAAIAAQSSPWTGLATMAAMIASLASIGIMLGGSGGGGTSAPVAGSAEYSKMKIEDIDRGTDVIVGRLDTQIELLEALNMQGSALSVGVDVAEAKYKADMDSFNWNFLEEARVTLEDGHNKNSSISKAAQAVQFFRDNQIDASAQVWYNNHSSPGKSTDYGSYLTYDDFDLSDALKMMNAIKEVGDEYANIDFEIDELYSASWVKGTNETTGLESAYQLLDNDIEKGKLIWEELALELSQAVNEYALVLISTVDEVRDVSDSLKDIYDNITGTSKYYDLSVKEAYSDVKIDMGLSEFDVLDTDALATHIEDNLSNIQVVLDTFTEEDLEILTYEGVDKLSEQQNVLDRLNGALGTFLTLEDGKKLINNIDSYKLVGETMAKSTENIKEWTDSFKTEDELLQDMANTLGVAIPTTTKEMNSLFETLKLGQGGFTDIEADFMQRVKESIDAKSEQIETEDEATLSLQNQLDVLKGVKTQRDIELQGLNTLDIALKKQIWTIEDLNEVLANTETLNDRLELLQATTDAEKLAITRARELDELRSDENKNILKSIYAIEDAEVAEENRLQALEDSEKALEEAIEAERQLAEERYGQLKDEKALWELQQSVNQEAVSFFDTMKDGFRDLSSNIDDILGITRTDDENIDILIPKYHETLAEVEKAKEEYLKNSTQETFDLFEEKESAFLDVASKLVNIGASSMEYDDILAPISEDLQAQQMDFTTITDELALINYALGENGVLALDDTLNSAMSGSVSSADLYFGASGLTQEQLVSLAKDTGATSLSEVEETADIFSQLIWGAESGELQEAMKTLDDTGKLTQEVIEDIANNTDILGSVFLTEFEKLSADANLVTSESYFKRTGTTGETVGDIFGVNTLLTGQTYLQNDGGAVAGYDISTEELKTIVDSIFGGFGQKTRDSVFSSLLSGEQKNITSQDGTELFEYIDGKFYSYTQELSTRDTPVLGDLSLEVSAIDQLIDGSHANGLSYVPYDGYRAELHRGEQVLTAQERVSYQNSNLTSNNNQDIIQAIYKLEKRLVSIESSSAQTSKVLEDARTSRPLKFKSA